MAAVIRMPALAAGATEAAVQAWLVAVGDRVEAGQEIVEIETEKALVEDEAEAAGVVAALLGDAGAAAAVGARIAVLAGEGGGGGRAAGSAADWPAEAPGAAAAQGPAPAGPVTEWSEEGLLDPHEPAGDSAVADPSTEAAVSGGVAAPAASHPDGTPGGRLC